LSPDPFQLERFVDAQEDVYDGALAEIRAGAKRSHWMWFIFPQLAALGQSATAKRYGIETIAEARAYLDHPVLGTRLRECVTALQALPPAKAEQVFGPIDALKLRSSLTLFDAAGGGPQFAEALDRWFGGADATTRKLLGR
jgi:uncharacterized protein (DUF1810 family)